MTKDYLNLFDIDITRLEDEWISFPKTYYIHAKRLSDARAIVQEAEAQLEIAKTTRKEIEGTLKLKIQQKPEKYGITGKTTVQGIEAAMQTQKKYQKYQQLYMLAQDGLNNAWHEVNERQAILNSLDVKKKALENLVKLHGQSYFATPKASTEDGKAYIDGKTKKAVRRKAKKNA